MFLRPFFFFGMKWMDGWMGYGLSGSMYDGDLWIMRRKRERRRGGSYLGCLLVGLVWLVRFW